jgi:DNA-binding winged helix-turn-helix (wHTH) protein/Tfp pilus assembly protein PilF
MPEPTAYEFGPFHFEPSEHKLRAGEAVLPLTPRACDVLLELLRNRGHLLLKQDLMDRIWPESFVEESNLTQTIYVLRRTLASVDAATDYIETVPRKGYRFRAEARELRVTAPEESLPHPHPAVSVVAPRSIQWLQVAALLIVLLFGGVAGWRSYRPPTEGAPAVAPLSAEAVEPIPDDAQPIPVAAIAKEQRPFVARRAYARGTFALSKRTQEGVRQAISRFQEAIRLDESYAPAYAGLADAYAYSAYYNFDLLPQREAYEDARQWAQRAIALDRGAPEPYLALALVRSQHDRDKKSAEEAYKRALVLSPRNAAAYQRHGIYLLEQGRLGQARLEIRRSLELDPLSPAANADYCYALYVSRLPDQAAPYCNTALEVQPDQVQGYLVLGLIAQLEGDTNRALRNLERARSRARGDSYFEVMEALGAAYAASGNRTAAMEIHDQLEQAARDRVAARASAAGLKATLGDVEGAVRELRALSPQGDLPADFLLDPRYESLRAHPAFRALRAANGARGGHDAAPTTSLADSPE